MIDYIKYTIDGESYQLINDGNGIWVKELNAPTTKGGYELLLEIGQNGMITYIDSKDPRYNFYLEVISDIEQNVNIMNYVPIIIKDIEEFEKIFNSQNIELDKFYDGILNANLNSFIRSSSNDRITRIEEFLRIKGLGSLDQRKLYLLSLYQRGNKLNEIIIKEIVNTITGSDCIVNFYGSDELNNPRNGFGLLQVQVLSPSNDINYRYADIIRSLKPLVPVHIKLLVIKYFSTWNDIMGNFKDWDAVSNNMLSWRNIKDYIPPLE